MNCQINRKAISRPKVSRPYPSRRYRYEPPDPGMAAPSSLQTIPSGIAISTATIQPNIACGPPSADIKSGIVMNGPTPIMFDMFSAVDCNSPKRLSRGASSFPGFRDSDAMEINEPYFGVHIISEYHILQRN